LETKRYSYSGLAEILDSPKRTPRYWVTEGLMPQPEIRDGRRKYFSEKQVEEAKALKRLVKDLRQSFDRVKKLKSMVIGNLGHMGHAEDYPFSLLMGVLDGISERDDVRVEYLLDRMIEGSEYIDPRIAGGCYIFQENVFIDVDAKYIRDGFLGTRAFPLDDLEEYFQRPTHYRHDNTPKQNKRNADFVRKLVNESILYPPRYRSKGDLFLLREDIKLAETWKGLFKKLGEPPFTLLHELKQAIERNIMEILPYPPPKNTELMDRSIWEITAVNAILNHISDEISALNLLYYPDQSKGLTFIDQYIEGFYFIFPYYSQLPNAPFMGKPLLVKTPITELSPQLLRKAEALSLYTTEEVANEAERRIKQYGEDVKSLRYKVLKNLRRRKK